MLETGPGDRKLDPFARRLEAYLRATLHLEVRLLPWPAGKGLPIYVARQYRFFEGVIAGQHCLFLAEATPAPKTPKEIAQHMRVARAAFDGLIVFAASTMNATLRARLLAEGLAFVVPGKQLYVPQLAMDLRDHFLAKERRSGKSLTPAAQVVLFDHLLGLGQGTRTPTDMALRLPYTAMSIGRAFDELALHNLARVERLEHDERVKTLNFGTDKRTLLDASKTLLRSPVRGVHAVRFKHERPVLMRAGETALGDLTNLAPPTLVTYAIPAANWKDFFKDEEIEDIAYEYEGEAKIETWRYDPKCLSRGNTVDPLSLYAQYWDHADERLAQAADALLEQIPWW